MNVETMSNVLREVWHPMAMLPRSEDVVRGYPDLPRPRYLYLTKAYVDWLGIAIGPVATPRRNRGYAAFGEGGCLPSPGLVGHVEGFEFEGWLYGREFHGAYRVIGIRHYKRPGPHCFRLPIVKL